MSFIKGVDISSLPQMLAEGKHYQDQNGHTKDPLALLKENQVNWIRLRIWNEPNNVPASGGYCDLAETIAFAKQIKAYDFQWLLDFHYSDWWADPAQQNKPKAWENLTLDKLVESVYDYTKHVLTSLDEVGCYPDMVQIGNEIRSGMLFPDGAVSNWQGLARLINAGIQAVRDTQKNRPTEVMIHLDQGGRYYYFEEWFDAAIAHDVTDFDCIGLSYYPFWHGGFEDLRKTMDFLADKYQKPLIVAETAHGWKTGNNGMFHPEQAEIAGFPASPKGQKDVLELVMNITKHTKDQLGKGIFYWEPMMLPLGEGGGWGEDMGLYDHDGNPMEGLSAYHFTPGVYQKEVARVFPLSLGYVKLGTVPHLPNEVSVLQWDGTLSTREVQWESSENCFVKEGDFVLEGSLVGTHLKAVLTGHCCVNLPTHQNLLHNGDFAEGLQGWTQTKTDDVKVELKAEFTRPFPEPPETAVEFSSQNNFRFVLAQQVDGLEQGTYDLSIEMSGDNTTGVEIELFCVQDDVRTASNIFLTGNGYETYTLSGIAGKEKAVQLGVLIQSPPIRGKLKNMTLIRR